MIYYLGAPRADTIFLISTDILTLKGGFTAQQKKRGVVKTLWRSIIHYFCYRRSVCSTAGSLGFLALRNIGIHTNPKDPAVLKRLRRSKSTLHSRLTIAKRFAIGAHIARTPFSWELQTFFLSKKGSQRSKLEKVQGATRIGATRVRASERKSASEMVSERTSENL